MLDAVLDQGLQQHAGHQQLQRVGIDFLHHAQLLRAKPHHLDAQVVVGKGQLFAERHIRIVILEQRAQDVAQLHNHLPRHLRPEADQRSDGIERVEQKVGIDLPLQGVEARFQHQPLLFLQLDLDAAGIPDFERDGHHHRGADARCRPCTAKLEESRLNRHPG